MSNIADSEEYKDYEQRHNRHLNMLTDSDRNIRKQALQEFKKSTASIKNNKVLELFYKEKLCKRLVLCLEDQVEKNREWTIEIFTTVIEKCGLEEEAQIIIPAICNRMNKNPFAEPCKYFFPVGYFPPIFSIF